MNTLSDSELHEMVHRVLQRTFGDKYPDTQIKITSDDLMQNQHTVSEKPSPSEKTQRTIALGADHGGFDLKEKIKGYLVTEGFPVDDCGTFSSESVDYPDFALQVARKVSSGCAWRGIMIDGAGIGSCIVANKVAGVRAAMCYDHATAVNSREHNDANVLTLGAGLIGANLALQIVKTWLSTDFAEGRHSRRVEKIMSVEKDR